MLLGCSIFLLSSGFLAIWTSQLAINLWRVEGRNPLMSLVQYGCGIAIVVIVVINCSLWLGAAYRPEAGPDVVVALNDAAAGPGARCARSRAFGSRGSKPWKANVPLLGRLDGCSRVLHAA